MNAQCLLCGERATASVEGIFDTRFGIGNSYNISICDKCALEQTVPVPSSQELKALYEKYYNFGGEKDTIYTRLRELFLFSFFYRLWIAIDGDISFHGDRGSGRLLDVGCNEGRGLNIYKRNGFSAEGLELNEVAAATARYKGFKVYTQLLEEFQPDEGYDVVVLSNVLEHSLAPKEMMHHVKRVLKPDGQVWISCPNNRSWLRVLFGAYWINWHVPFHIVHFSSDTLRRLLDESGFKDIQVCNATPSLWVSHSIIARLFAEKGRATTQLRNPLLVLTLMLFFRLVCFPGLWLGNILKRGDCLITRARKG